MGVLAFVIVALIWARFAELDEVTSGIGKVIPSSQIQIVSNLEGVLFVIYMCEKGNKSKKVKSYY